MGRTKNLAIEQKEKKELPEHFVDGKEVAETPTIPLKGPQPPAPRVETVKDVYLINEPMLKALLTYLDSRPHGEVKNLMNSLSSLAKIAEMTLTVQPQNAAN